MLASLQSARPTDRDKYAATIALGVPLPFPRVSDGFSIIYDGVAPARTVITFFRFVIIVDAPTIVSRSVRRFRRLFFTPRAADRVVRGDCTRATKPYAARQWQRRTRKV